MRDRSRKPAANAGKIPHWEEHSGDGSKMRANSLIQNILLINPLSSRFCEISAQSPNPKLLNAGNLAADVEKNHSCIAAGSDMSASQSRTPRQPKASRPQAPGYGFPKGAKGLLPWSWAEQRLKKSHNYWIVTVKPDGSPHVMVVWGMWQDERFLFSTGSQSRKARNLASNPNCVVSTEDAHEAVIVEGIAEIADAAARRKMIPAYQRKYDWDLSAMKDDMLSMKEPVFAVRPKTVFGLWEKHFQTKSTRWKFKD